MKLSRATRRVLALVLGLLLGTVAWIFWTELHPTAERTLRLTLRDQLTAWFPDEMRPPEGVFGWKTHQTSAHARATVILVHGLDEPGDIWDDVIVAFAKESVEVWELRYPNDQAVDRSAAFMAEVWPELPSDRPVIALGHSMGGLVIREFVGAWRHPVPGPSRVEGAPVKAVFLIGTPNHGSEWARLRSWLEMREQFIHSGERDFSLFAALRDGAGVAKIDLRPGSEFLNTLNARSWPESIDLRLIAGDLMDDELFRRNLRTLLQRAPSGESAKALRRWWDGLGEALGDGVVTVESVRLEEASEVVVLPASHRGLIRVSTFEPEDPPAIPVLLEWTREAVR